MNVRLIEYLDQRASERRVQIAREWGISEAYLSQLASGVRSPSRTLAFRIEDKTGGAVPARSWEEAAA